MKKIFYLEDSSVEGIWEVVVVLVVVAVWVAGGLEVWELLKEGRRSLKKKKQKIIKTIWAFVLLSFNYF